jgi:hypothetical protein
MGDWDYAADGSGRRIRLNDWSYEVQPGGPLYPNKRLIIYTKVRDLLRRPLDLLARDVPVLETGPRSCTGDVVRALADLAA